MQEEEPSPEKQVPEQDSLLESITNAKMPADDFSSGIQHFKDHFTSETFGEDSTADITGISNSKLSLLQKYKSNEPKATKINKVRNESKSRQQFVMKL